MPQTAKIKENTTVSSLVIPSKIGMYFIRLAAKQRAIPIKNNCWLCCINIPQLAKKQIPDRTTMPRGNSHRLNNRLKNIQIVKIILTGRTKTFFFIMINLIVDKISYNICQRYIQKYNLSMFLLVFLFIFVFYGLKIIKKLLLL